MCSFGLNWQYVIIGPENGLAPIRRQSIFWTSDDLVYWRAYASLGLNALNGLSTVHPECAEIACLDAILKPGAPFTYMV